MEPLQRQALIRCGRKRAYRKPALADEAAWRASTKTGEWIISYQCYECLQWHIGHADKSQILARTSPGRPTCEICWQPIDTNRLEKAERKGICITTCSRACQQELARKTGQNPPSRPFQKG